MLWRRGRTEPPPNADRHAANGASQNNLTEADESHGMHPVGFDAYWAPSSRVGPLAVVRVLLPSGAPLASTLGHLGLPFIVIARAIALTIPCLPHWLADESVLARSLVQTGRAIFRRSQSGDDIRTMTGGQLRRLQELAAERRQWLGLGVRERRRRRIWRTALSECN